MKLSRLLCPLMLAGLAACHHEPVRTTNATPAPASTPAPAAATTGAATPGPRDVRPSDLANAAFSPSQPENFTLKNGIHVMLWSKRELPLVAIQILLHPGGPLDNPEHAGRSSLTAQMLEEGAGNLDATAFADTMQALGATFNSGASTESASVSLMVLRRNLDKACGLMADAILHPRMEAVDWERVKRLHLEDLKEEQDNPQAVAGHVASRVFFGKDSAYAWPVSGTDTTVTALTLDAIKAHHQALYTPAAATILISGDITPADAKALLDKHFGPWPSTPFNRMVPTPAPSKPLDHMRLIIVDRPKAVQTIVTFMTPGVPYNNNQRVQLQLLNTLFGGSFTSRINQNLREAHGYTYGAHSGFMMEPTTGCFTAGAAVRADVTGESLKEFLAEFKKISSGTDITPDEASKGIATARTNTIERFGGLRGVLGTAAQLTASNLPFSTVGTDLNTMTTVTAAQLNTLAKTAMPIDHGVLVLVGDKATILPQIKDLGLPTPEEYTIKGEPK